jgi:hypothetical protein
LYVKSLEVLVGLLDLHWQEILAFVLMRNRLELVLVVLLSEKLHAQDLASL